MSISLKSGIALKFGPHGFICEEGNICVAAKKVFTNDMQTIYYSPSIPKAIMYFKSAEFTEAKNSIIDHFDMGYESIEIVGNFHDIEKLKASLHEEDLPLIYYES